MKPDPDPKPGSAAAVTAGAEGRAGDDRRAEHDRRAPGPGQAGLSPGQAGLSQAGQTHLYAGPERRAGPRRAAELPSSIWRQPLIVGLAIVMGIAAGLAVDSLSRQPRAQVAAGQTDTNQAELVDAEALAGVQALRDEAEALTAAQVELDETAHERWMPRVALIERALEDPSTPPPLRHELSATIAALECVGVLGGPSAATCATLER